MFKKKDSSRAARHSDTAVETYYVVARDLQSAHPFSLQNGTPADMARPDMASESGPAARRAHGPPRRARARGSRGGHIVACSRARARQQIKISQNSGTPVPKCGKNG